ncbi:MAG TPA: hypothetical protein VFC19_36970 [Candidatus Limnocylindrales bacterium]|nr:hypothetical protein [Candidatus Limnocylindrales bacterium]
MRRVVFVLLAVQAGTILLAMLGELLFMRGLPFYAAAPLIRVILTLVCAGLIVRGHRGAIITTIVLQGLSLAGFSLSMAAGVLPQVAFTPTLTGLVTGVVLPIVVIVYCGHLLKWRRA